VSDSSEPGEEPGERRGPPWGPWRGGPPWRDGSWGAGGGGFGPWDRRDPRFREMQRRAWLMRRMERPGPRHAWQGFGCLFALLFLIVAGSLVTVVATLLSTFGPVLAVIAAVSVGLLLFGMGRTLALTARALDRLVEATRQVEAGDYSVRVRPRRRSAGGLRVVHQLTGGFDTMVARLEADEEQRRTLLADVSHELRTPLTVIIGNLEAILDGVYPADSTHLTPILDETRVLERLIDDVRTVALSEAGTLALHREPTDLDVLIGDVLRSFAPAAATAEVSLQAETSGDLPILDLDPVRIREVLSNLIANALRHTPSGGTVTLSGSATASAVTLRVHDTGPGIDPKLLPHVFDRFVKGEGSRGSGLGLAIARGLVEAHGGVISTESPTGGGTTFRVELPRTTD
jgi:two-component system sensor histidine kinase BaeS